MTVVRSIDLSDDHTFADGFPHDYFTWLREHQPVSWHEPTDATPDGEGFWVVSRYADAHAVLRDPTTFSSECGGIRKGGGTAIKDEAVAGTMLNQSDDPQHHRLRSLVSRGFTPRAVANLESDLRTVADALLSATDPLSFDFVSGFARELPSQAICSVLGVPMQDRPNLLNWLDSGLEEKSQSIIAERAIEQIFGYARHLIDAKRSKPDEAMFSQIVHASDPAGEKLTEAELLAFFALLFPAGAETTRSALAGAVKAFAEFPDQYDRLRSDSGLLAPAIEEIVRWTTPSIYKRRTASRNTVLGSTSIRAGDKVTLWEMSANRDASVFSDPFRFDVSRSPNPHLGFGWGLHFCLGASLARLELRVVLQLLLQKVKRMELTGTAEWTPNNRLLGLRHLPIRMWMT